MLLLTLLSTQWNLVGICISNLINNTLVSIVGYSVRVSYEGGCYNRHGAMMMLMMMRMMVGLAVMSVMMMMLM